MAGLMPNIKQYNQIDFLAALLRGAVVRRSGFDTPTKDTDDKGEAASEASVGRGKPFERSETGFPLQISFFR